MTIPVMTRTLVIALSFIAAYNSRAAKPASIEVLELKRAYPSASPCELNKVDFRNFTYFVGEWMGSSNSRSPEDPVRVSHGKHRLHEPGGFEDLLVENVLHPDGESAVVSLLHNYGGGSSNQDLVVMVFQCVDGKLTNTQLIRGDGHGEGTGAFFSEAGRKMTMKSVYDYTLGHCCPRYLETATFKLAKGRYTLLATHEKENHF